MVFLREKDDSYTPVTPPVMELQLVTASNIVFSQPSYVTALPSNTSLAGSYFDVLSVDSSVAEAGTILLTINKIRSFEIEITESDLLSVTAIASKIYSVISSIEGYTAFLTGSTLELGSLYKAPEVSSENPYPRTTEYVVNLLSQGVNAQILPKDDLKISLNNEEQIAIQDHIVASQFNIPYAQDPYSLYHSALKNPFYRKLSDSLTQELQNIIYKGSDIKNYWDITFFDGDEPKYQARIKDLIQTLGSSFPLDFIKISNVENGDIVSVEKQNDFFRRLIKSIGLMRRWSGSSTGYAMLMKLLGRLGATHLGVLYPTTTSLTSTTGRSFRFLNSSELTKNLPGSETFPNSVHIGGMSSLSKVVAPPYRYDTGLTWDAGVIITPSMFPGDINVVFGPFQDYPGLVANKYYMAIKSVALATPGQFSFLNTVVSINSSDIKSETAFAEKVASGSYQGWEVTVETVNTFVSLVVKSNSSGSLTWDSVLSFNYSGKSIMLEVSLDRMLYHTNSLGSKESLLEVGFLESIEALLPYVKRSQDNTFIGSQLSLTTSNDGRFNTLSQSSYSHPNIKAKFQIFKYRPGLKQAGWSNLLDVAYIKLGIGGYRNSYIDNSVFVPTGMAPNDPTREVPSDLVSPVFRSNISINEKTNISGYDVLGCMVNSISIENYNISSTVIVGNSNNSEKYRIPTYIDLVNKDISSGTIALGMEINVPFESSPGVPDPTREPLNQRIFFYQERDDLNGVFNPIFKYQEVNSLGSYIDTQSGSLLNGYTTDYMYAGRAMGYFPSVQKQTIVLSPIVEKDKYWYLNTNQVLNLNLDVATVDSTIDMWVSQSTGFRSASTVAVSGATLQPPMVGLTSNHYHFTTPGSGITVTDVDDIFSDIGDISFMATLIPENAIGTATIIDLGSWKVEYTNSGVTETFTITAQGSTSDGVWAYQKPYASTTIKTVGFTTNTTTKAPLFYYNGQYTTPTSSTDLVGSVVYSSINPVVASNYVGGITEVCVLSVSLLKHQMEKLHHCSLNRKNAVINSNNEPAYCWIDETNGKVCAKLQYNPFGAKANGASLEGTYSPYSTISKTSYKIGYSETTLGITELGIFNEEEVLLAYATFPPIIYDQSKNHLSLNLMIQQ